MAAEEVQPIAVVVVPDDLEEYRDIDKELDDFLTGGATATDLASMIERHQVRINPDQRRVLLYLLDGTPRMRRYAQKWLDLASREANAGDFIRLQEAMTFSIPEQNRNLSLNPQAPMTR